MENNKIKKINNKMEVDEALNRAKLKKAEFDLKEKNVYRKITEINREAKAEKKIMFSGLLINAIIIIGLIASSIIICMSGLKVYKSHSIAFIVSMLFVELLLFQSYYNSTIIKQKFYRHYSKLKLMQIGLLIVLIYYNFSFFYSYVRHDKLLVVATFILCFLVEFSIMNLASLSRDMRILNYTFNDNNIDENTSIIKMLWFNLMYKIRKNALEKYQENVEEYKQLSKKPNQKPSEEKEKIFIKVYEESEPEEIKLLEDSTTDPKETEEKLFEKKELHPEVIEKVFKYILENRTENISPGMGKISKNTGVNYSEVGRIRDVLIKYGYLQPDKQKMQTLVIRDDLNLSDFEGEE